MFCLNLFLLNVISVLIFFPDDRIFLNKKKVLFIEDSIYLDFNFVEKSKMIRPEELLMFEYERK